MLLPHEKLIVHEKALLFVKTMMAMVDQWPANLAVSDQLIRACESLILNLVKAAGRSYSSMGMYNLDCSLGSALECAACLDIAYINELIDASSLNALKEALQSIVRLEIGLRKEWDSCVHEPSAQYETNQVVYFSHESLNVYQSALQIYRLIRISLAEDVDGWHRYARKADEAVTGLALNIAEGNGRYSKLDRGKFIAIAEDAGCRLAAYLELSAVTNSTRIESIKSVLREVMAMLGGMKQYLKGSGASPSK